MIRELKIYPFSLHIRCLTKERKGFLVQAKTEERSFWTEVSPLPAHSKESFEKAEKQLLFLQKKLPFFLTEILHEHSFCPSVSFGLDSLKYSLMGCMPQLSTYPLCAFLSGSFEEMLEQIPLIFFQGYEYIKVKLSHLSYKEAHQILALLVGKIKIKIDLNRAWSLQTALSFFQNYPQNTFEYIEEPLQNPFDLPLFPYPLALDETLRENIKLPFLPTLRALIIKPMLMGSASSIKKTISPFIKIKPQLVLSSSHESGVGLFHLCHFQHRLCIPPHPLGVDTYRFIEKDILINPHIISQGKLTLSSLEGSHAASICTV